MEAEEPDSFVPLGHTVEFMLDAYQVYEYGLDPPEACAVSVRDWLKSIVGVSGVIGPAESAAAKLALAPVIIETLKMERRRFKVIVDVRI
jgi:hypothetical protein